MIVLYVMDKLVNAAVNEIGLDLMNLKAQKFIFVMAVVFLHRNDSAQLVYYYFVLIDELWLIK